MKARTGNTSPGPGPLLPPAGEPLAECGSEVGLGRGSPVVVTASRPPPPPEPASEPATPSASRPRPSAMKLARIPSPGIGPAERRPTVDDSRPYAIRPDAVDPDSSVRPRAREPVGGSLSPAALGARTRSPITGRGVAIGIGLLMGGFAALAVLSSPRPRGPAISTAHASRPTLAPSSATGSSPPRAEISVTSRREDAPAAASAQSVNEPALVPSAPAGSVDTTRSDEQRRTQPSDRQAGTGGKGSRVPSEHRARPYRSSSAMSSSPSSVHAQTPNPHVPDDLYF
jgi:hypothetical protein